MLKISYGSRFPGKDPGMVYHQHEKNSENPSCIFYYEKDLNMTGRYQDSRRQFLI